MKHASRRKHSNEHIFGVSNGMRSSKNRVHPLKALSLLLLRFSNLGLPQTAFMAEALAGQFRAGSDVQMKALPLPIADLERQLALALEMEDYVKAATLRDELKAARSADLVSVLALEREKRLNVLQANALSTEAPFASRVQAVREITDMALPPMPAAGAEDALHRILLETTGDLQEKTEQALWTVWSDPGDEVIEELFSRGVAYMEQQCFSFAAFLFTQVLEKAPEFVEARSKRATVYFFMKDIGRCIEDCEQVLKSKPRHFGCLSFMGYCRLNQGDDAGALQYLKAAIEVNPGFAKELKRTIDIVDWRLRDTL